MKRPFPPLHPFAIVLFPILSLYSHNLGLFPWTDVARPIGIALVATVGVYVVSWVVVAAVWSLRVRNGGPGSWVLGPGVQAAAAITSVAVFEFFTFGYVYDWFATHARDFLKEWALGSFVDSPTQFLGIWIPLSILILLPFAWKRRSNAGLTRFFNAAGVVLLVLPLFSIVTGLISIRKDLSRLSTPGESGSAANLSGATAPDIIYVILDGYGREDALKAYFNLDNGPFIQALEQRGFYVAKKARSNYCQTELSLSSSLNMNFVQDLVGPMPKDSMDRAPLDRLLDRSAVADFLKKRGYEYIAITSGFPGVNPSTADVRLTDTQGYSLFEASLMANTPFRASSTAVGSQYDARRNNLAAALDHLTHLPPRGLKPRFIFAHILAPHPPFVYGPNGEAVRPSHTTFGYWDASAFFAVGGTMPEYIKGYSDQLLYLNKRVLQAVDQIEKDERVPPIIIFQGDHGSRAHLSQETLEKSDVRESFRNLNAYLVPPQVKAKLYPSITPVNSFRLILDGAFGANYPLLPDRSYFTTWERPYDPIDVTDMVEKPLAR